MKMSLSRKLTVILFLIGASALSANAQKVTVGVQPGADLTKYKTYSWSKGLGDPNPNVHQLIVAAVDQEMMTKGITKVASDGELVVSAFVWTESEVYAANASWTPVLNSISTGVAVGSQSWPVTKGTLVVEIADAKSKDGLWRGTATHTLNHGPTGDKVKDAKSVEKPIKKAVVKMFKKFPRP
jgi:hypothetical protein